MHVGGKLVCDNKFLVSEERMTIQWNAETIMHLEKDSDITSGRRISSVLSTRKKCLYCPKDGENLSIKWNPEKKIHSQMGLKKSFYTTKTSTNQAKRNKPETSATRKRVNILSL